MGDEGLEPVSTTATETTSCEDYSLPENQSGAESGAVAARSDAYDDDLQILVDAWPRLPFEVRAAILTLADNPDTASG